ncbi:hypothetical protein TSOC_006174 [Tetrabaena socialis]|uniref:Uncharacterized protein n=1 Tax=Tetrabaena socialis TaxID=47790 RepID=A0A2J8A4B1_9CHLO|nr:hypothetical protein TSOC_006174 [Tetrabaena socialis]|eukprot:PNH07345.1 hypothetical protein TSOC_006174 [Tetrabaena socialis]
MATDAVASTMGSVHDDAGGVPPPETDETQTFIIPEMTSALNTINDFFNSQVLPRSRAIETEVANLTYEANAVSNAAEAERANLEKELARLSNLVQSFQSRISQYLHFGAFGGHQG